MAAPRYRIGNDLTVLWAINNRDGSPFDMNGKEVKLFVVNSRGREEVEATLTTMEDGSVDNVIRWDFSGDRQRVTGLYALEVEIKASDTHKKIKKDICEAFVLVSKSEMESDLDEGEPYVYDGGMLVLSSRLDVFRFGIAKIEIGTNGNWFIDNVDTGTSALGGGPGLVSKIYNEDDFGKSFDKNSVIDTFNAYAIESLRKKIEDLKLEDLKDVLAVATEEGDVLTYKNGFWRSAKPTGGSGGGTTEPGEYDEQIEAIINSIFDLGSRLSAMWTLSDDGKQIITSKEVVINNNAIISGDAASGGEGQYTPAGIAGIRVNGTLYTDDNADGIIDLGVISGGDVDVDLTDYYTKDEANSKFISTSNIGSQSVANASKVGNKSLTVSKTANFNGVAHIGSDGVMEVGRYIDFHRTNVDEVDYVTRVQLGNGTGVNTITLPESSGTLALLTSNVAAAKKLVTSGLVDAVTIATDKTASFLGNIKIQPADREDVSLSFISGVESGQFYDYKIGKFTDANSISGFGIAMANTNGAWVKFLSLTTDTSYNVTSVDFQRALHAKKDAYFSGHMYVGASSNLMLGDKTAGIYITYNAISWHNDSNSYSSSIFGFDSAAIRVYKTLRPNTNQLCALGSSSYRWSGVYAAAGDFSGNVSVTGNLIVTGDVASA